MNNWKWLLKLVTVTHNFELHCSKLLPEAHCFSRVKLSENLPIWMASAPCSLLSCSPNSFMRIKAQEIFLRFQANATNQTVRKCHFQLVYNSKSIDSKYQSQTNALYNLKSQKQAIQNFRCNHWLMLISRTQLIRWVITLISIQAQKSTVYS
jgi:hypothetical protein